MLALQALCAFEAVDEEFKRQLDEFLHDEHVLADLDIDLPPPPELIDFARGLASAAWAQRKSLDETISRAAIHWSLERMIPVDRNILRMGLHELLEHRETPPKVVINEAIELARRFGDADSPAFVNGVLDAVHKTLIEAPESLTESPPAHDATDNTESRDGTV